MSRPLFELILAIKRQCQCNEEQIQEQLGLSSAEFHGLMVLEAGGEILGCEFARRMGLSPSRGSRVLSALVTGGYVRTQLSPNDRRAILISLTSRGRQMKRRIVTRMETCERRLRDNLDDARLGQVADALEWLATTL